MPSPTLPLSTVLVRRAGPIRQNGRAGPASHWLQHLGKQALYSSDSTMELGLMGKAQESQA